MSVFRAFFPHTARRSYGAIGSLIAEYIRAGSDGAAYGDDAAMRIAVTNSCVRLIAETVGSLPLHAYRRLEGRGKARLPLTNSLEKLLQRPNPNQTSLEFREQLTGHLLLRGNAYAYIDWQTTKTDTGQVLLQAVGLYPLNPDQIEVTAAGGGEAEKAQAPTYMLVRSNGQKLPIPSDDMLHIRGLSSDGLVGRSVLTDAKDSFASARLTQDYAKRLFENDATPGVILEHPGTLGPEAVATLRETFDSFHAGARNARRTAVLEEGMKANRIGIAPNDSQFLETRQYQRQEISGLFRVPPHLIGDVDRSTSWGTGIEQQQIAFLSYTIRPWLVRWEQAISKALILREDDIFVEHLVDALLRGDTTSRYGAYVQGVNNGILTPNDVRAAENLNPYPDKGADMLYRNANMVPIDAPAAGAAGTT